MVNNCFYTKFRAKIVKIFEIYKKNRLLSDFLFYFHILLYHSTTKHQPCLSSVRPYWMSCKAWYSFVKTGPGLSPNE